MDDRGRPARGAVDADELEAHPTVLRVDPGDPEGVARGHHRGREALLLAHQRADLHRRAVALALEVGAGEPHPLAAVVPTPRPGGRRCGRSRCRCGCGRDRRRPSRRRGDAAAGRSRAGRRRGAMAGTAPVSPGAFCTRLALSSMALGRGWRAQGRWDIAPWAPSPTARCTWATERCTSGRSEHPAKPREARREYRGHRASKPCA